MKKFVCEESKDAWTWSEVLRHLQIIGHRVAGKLCFALQAFARVWPVRCLWSILEMIIGVHV